MSEWTDDSQEPDTNFQTLIKLGFTAILLGYLLVWIPHDVAGLSFIGLEIGEWVKFVPQVRSGQISADRNLFYLPPITLGLMLALWTVGWPNRRWQTWAMRAVAVLVALLAFPAIEAILDEGPGQWLVRVIMIAVVALVAALAWLVNRLPRQTSYVVSWGVTLFLALTGLVLPMWAFLEVRPAVTNLIGAEIGIGPGIWLNGFGHLLVAAVALALLLRQRRLRRRHGG